jgi:DNA-binding LytR/AlgR family response regulator
MADGNYVDFYILNNQNIDKQTIRNSISNIHKQLSHLPYIIKTHRAYIVNVKMVKSKKGNSSGYKLKIDDSIDNIPVSRNNIKLFDNVSGKYL